MQSKQSRPLTSWLRACANSMAASPAMRCCRALGRKPWWLYCTSAPSASAASTKGSSSSAGSGLWRTSGSNGSLRGVGKGPAAGAASVPVAQQQQGPRHVMSKHGHNRGQGATHAGRGAAQLGCCGCMMCRYCCTKAGPGGDFLHHSSCRQGQYGEGSVGHVKSWGLWQGREATRCPGNERACPRFLPNYDDKE